MTIKRFSPLFLSLGLFLSLMRFGVYFASIKPLENDEIHTQIHSVEAPSYQGILSGLLKGESNNSPLFYLIQKKITEIVHYQAPLSWHRGERSSTHKYSMVLLRMSSIFCVSLAVTLTFYYFVRHYSLMAGVYSFFVSASLSYMWLYLAEARPYGLWILLTVIQLILFLDILDEQKVIRWREAALFVTNVLLSLTVIISLGQVVIVSLLLWVWGARRWKGFLWQIALPCAIVIYYYFQLEPYPLWMLKNFMDLIYSCFPLEYLGIVVGYALFISIQGIFLKRKEKAESKKPKLLRTGNQYLMFTILMFLAALLLVAAFMIRSHGHTQGHMIVARYFLFLTPLSIFGVTLFSIHLLKGFQGKPWLQANILISLLALLALVFLKNHTLWMFLEFLRA